MVDLKWTAPFQTLGLSFILTAEKQKA